MVYFSTDNKLAILISVHGHVSESQSAPLLSVTHIHVGARSHNDYYCRIIRTRGTPTIIVVIVFRTVREGRRTCRAFGPHIVPASLSPRPPSPPNEHIATPLRPGGGFRRTNGTHPTRRACTRGIPTGPGRREQRRGWEIYVYRCGRGNLPLEKQLGKTRVDGAHKYLYSPARPAAIII